MFNNVECYSGGVFVPDAEVEMEQHPATDDAPKPASDASLQEEFSGDIGNAQSDRLDHQEPQSIVRNAYKEADRIVAEAREAARLEAAAIVEKAQAHAGEIQALSISRAATGMGLELWASRHALSGIVEQALTAMIGEIGADRALFHAVVAAIRTHCSNHTVKVRAEKRTADRLRLVELSNRNKLPVSVFQIVDDNALEAGRCVIDAEGKLLEVSLDQQVEAIKEACDRHIAAATDEPDNPHFDADDQNIRTQHGEKIDALMGEIG